MAALKRAVAAAEPLIQALAPAGSGDGAGGDDGRAGRGMGTADDVPVLLSGAGHDAMAVTDLTKVCARWRFVI